MKLREEDLRRVVWLSDPALSPDGKTAVYVRAVSDYNTGENAVKVTPGRKRITENLKKFCAFSVPRRIT